MVNVQEQEVKKITPNQERLIYQLLQSRVITKKEFERYYQELQKKIVTSYDASLLIGHLLTLIRYRKQFWSKKQRSKARCCICGSRENLIRYAELPDLKQKWYCETCDFELTEARKDEVLHPSSVTEIELRK